MNIVVMQALNPDYTAVMTYCHPDYWMLMLKYNNGVEVTEETSDKTQALRWLVEHDNPSVGAVQ